MNQLKRIIVGVAGMLLIMNARASLFEKKDARVENKELAQYVPKPIPCGPDAPTTWQFKNDKLMPFFRKQVIDPFKASAEASQPWAPEALKVLEEECEALCEMQLLEQVPICKKADKLIKNGCTYPVILWMQVIGFYQEGKMKQASDGLKKLDETLARTPDQWFVKFLMGIAYQAIDPSPKNEKLFATRTAEWIQKGALTRDDSRYVLWLLSDLKREASPAVLAAFEKATNIDPWLTLMLRGGVVRKQAWDMRGRGWASTVTDEGWKGFSEGIALARKSFEEAWRLHPEFPNAATMMIDICGSTCGEEMRLWFDRAVAVEIDRLAPYMTYAWYSRPRWGGSIEEMYAFAESCYQTKRHDTQIPLFYVTIMFQIAEDVKCDLKDVFTRPGVHEKSVEVLTAMAKNKKAHKDIQIMAAELLPVVEYIGGSVQKAVEYNKIRKGAHSDSSRSYLPNDFNQIFKILNGLMFQNAKSLIAAEDLYRAGRYEESLAAFTVIRNAGNLRGEETDYLIYRLHCNELQTLFKRGEWVTPTFNNRSSSWLNYSGNWRLEDSGFRTDNQKCPLEWMPPVPDDVEYEGVFRFVAAAGQDSKASFQLDKFGDNGKPSILFSYANNKCQIAIGGKYDEPDTEPISVTCEKPEVRFRIVSCKNKVSVWVDGKKLIDGHDMSDYMRSFRKDGMRNLFLYGTRVAISDLRMRATDVTKK